MEPKGTPMGECLRSRLHRLGNSWVAYDRSNREEAAEQLLAQGVSRDELEAVMLGLNPDESMGPSPKPRSPFVTKTWANS